ncbi:hypothetical protein [Geodermatophilus sp. DSM 44513]|uniref:hypothetical protein n=1 Tax=Geodermatophilus sp. DSM 44513 TaxID=1528104 RepID=UPI001411C17B|nr:hypothetical protein [Geodermatophilus sp. DSM 44513]WNV74064.1 hypothetical protein RTG05_13810 [Geodermatophilus sp. DSM 44513]
MAAIVSAGGLYVGSGREAVTSVIDRSGWSWGEVAGTAISVGVGLTAAAALAWIALFEPTDPTLRETQHAVDVGELPGGARPEVWVPRLSRMLRELRRDSVLITVACGAVAAAVGAAAVDNDHDPAVGALAGALGLLAVAPLLWTSRRTRAVRRLLGTLDAGQPGR